MGASQSHDFEPNVERNGIKPQNHKSNVQPKEKAANTGLFEEKSRAVERTEKIQLPHNYEAILKDADSPVDMSSTDKLLSQLHAGVFLNRKRKKYWVDKTKRNCFMLYARDLSITWAEDSHYWHWSCQKETSSNVSIDVAELLEVCWLELNGKFDVAKLSPGTLYGVAVIVMLTEDAFGWEDPVNFRLTLPNGQKVERKENLTTEPRGKWIEIPVGEFTTSSVNGGELEIHIHEYDAGMWKGGLLVKGVSIKPKN